MGLTCGVGCVEGAPGPVREFRFFFESMLEATFFALGGILEDFGRPKWRSKSILEKFFLDVFVNCVLASFLNRFLEGRTFKNQ